MTRKPEFAAHTLVRTLKQEPNVPLYLGLMVASPATIIEGASLSLSEPVASSYTRQRVTFAFIDNEAFVVNQEQVAFSKANKKYGILTHIAIFDKPTPDANIICLKSIGFTLNIENGQPIIFDKGEIKIYVGQTNPSIL